MAEVRENWRECEQRLQSSEFDFSKPVDRLAAITFIHEIVNQFIDPTADAMVPEVDEHPPGGWGYSCEHWVWGSRDWWEVEDAYGDAFGASWNPSASEVVQFLTEYGLELRSADSAQKLHHSWIGERAGARINSISSSLRAGAEDNCESPQRQEEFVRLAPLLDRSLPAGVASGLSFTLFQLSRTLGHEEAALRRGSFNRYIAAVLEMDARSNPIDDGGSGERS